MLNGFNLRRAGAALSVALLAVVPVAVEAAEVVARIPFSFAVGKQTLSPGMYRVYTGMTSDIIVLRGATGGTIAMTSPRYGSDDIEPRLVFHKYGDDYFLRQVWTGHRTAYVLPESRGERDRREGRRGSAASAPEHIVVPGL
jgi:hypothetical protein